MFLVIDEFGATMSRILFTLAAMGFLLAAVVAVGSDNSIAAVSCFGIMALLLCFAVLADRSGEGLPDPPKQSSP